MKRLTLISVMITVALLFSACAPLSGPQVDEAGGSAPRTSAQGPGAEDQAEDSGIPSNDPNAGTGDSAAAGQTGQGQTDQTGQTGQTDQTDQTNQTGQTDQTGATGMAGREDEAEDQGIPSDDPAGAVDVVPPAAAMGLPSSFGGLMNARIHNSEGAQIGEVHDILLSTAEPRVEYVVIDLGNRLALVPFSAFELRAVEASSLPLLTLRATASDLDEAPSTDSLVLESGLDAAVKESRSFWAGRMGVSEDQLASKDMTRLSVLIPAGVSIQGLGQAVGIQDIIFDSSGVAQYVILTGGSQLDLGSLVLPIPLSALNFSGDSETLVLDVDPTALQNAPTFTLEDLNAMIRQQGWEQGLQTFWEGLQ